jgi:lipoate-protein ligase A
MANKMTQKQYFEQIIEVVKEAGRDDLVKFAEERIKYLEEKSANRKPTANQQENVEFKEVIKAVLEGNEKGLTVSEIMTADEKLVGLTNQRVTALLTQLVKAEEVVRTVDKKKAYYTLAYCPLAN